MFKLLIIFFYLLHTTMFTEAKLLENRKNEQLSMFTKDEDDNFNLFDYETKTVKTDKKKFIRRRIQDKTVKEIRTEIEEFDRDFLW